MSTQRAEDRKEHIIRRLKAVESVPTRTPEQARAHHFGDLDVAGRLQTDPFQETYTIFKS